MTCEQTVQKALKAYELQTKKELNEAEQDELKQLIDEIVELVKIADANCIKNHWELFKKVLGDKMPIPKPEPKPEPEHKPKKPRI